MREPGLFIVLVDEPGRDLRALPGFFHDAESAVDEHVSFQEHPQAQRFLIVQVAGQIGPVRTLESPDATMARVRASLPRNPAGAAG